MRQPEDWVVSTAENAKRELSIVLSSIVPFVVLAVCAASIVVPLNDWLVLAAVTSLGVIPLATPLSVVGFITSDRRTKYITGPLTALSLLFFATLVCVYLAI